MFDGLGWTALCEYVTGGKKHDLKRKCFASKDHLNKCVGDFYNWMMTSNMPVTKMWGYTLKEQARVKQSERSVKTYPRQKDENNSSLCLSIFILFFVKLNSSVYQRNVHTSIKWDKLLIV